MLYLEKDWSAENIILKSVILFNINGAFTDSQSVGPSQELVFELVFELCRVTFRLLIIQLTGKVTPLMSDHLK